MLASTDVISHLETLTGFSTRLPKSFRALYAYENAELGELFVCGLHRLCKLPDLEATGL